MAQRQATTDLYGKEMGGEILLVERELQSDIIIFLIFK